MLSKNGKILYQRSIGYSNISPAGKIEATGATMYRIGSISKVFTATMIFQLIEEKKLSLETRLVKYFPAVANSGKISIAQMLSHTAGIGDYVGENQVWITEPHTRKEILDKIYKEPSAFEPGAKQQYSNSTYLLLSYIIEQITGKPYVSVVKTRIFDPAGMKQSLAGRPNGSEKLEARSYRLPATQEIKDIYFPNVMGVGDLLMTPKDMTIFMEALNWGKLLSQKSFNQMKTFAPGNGFGMGLMLDGFAGKTAIAHTGGTYGTGSILTRFDDDGLILALSINGQKYPIGNIKVAILNICLNRPYELPSFKEVIIAKEDLDAHAGAYSSNQLPLKISVRRKEGHLFAQATGQSEFPLDAVSANEFRFDQAAIVMEFDRSKKEMTLKQGGKTYLFSKDN